jgi:hypothetical protein
LAFTAVASDSGLLNRLGPAGALLAEQAEQFAIEVGKKGESSDPARAAAQIVRVRIQTWRTRAHLRAPLQKSRVRHAPEPDPVPSPLTFDDHLRTALTDFPHYREGTARVLFENVLRLGEAGAHLVGAPFDDAIMLATSRFAARSWRGLTRGDVPSRDDCAKAVSLVQDWAARSGKSPFPIDFRQIGASPDDFVTALCRDAATCLAIAARLPGGTQARGFPVWEEAEEYLCYAVLSLRPGHLGQLDIQAARAFAGAAARLATAVTNDETVRLPQFASAVEAGSPRRVLATTRFALPNGPEPRRSVRADLAPVEPT